MVLVVQGTALIVNDAADWTQLRVFAPLRANDVVTGNLKSSIQQKTFANRKIRHG